MKDQRREEFEKWHTLDMGLSPDFFLDEDGNYDLPSIQAAWRGYQVAMQAQEPKTKNFS